MTSRVKSGLEMKSWPRVIAYSSYKQLIIAHNLTERWEKWSLDVVSSCLGPFDDAGAEWQDGIREPGGLSGGRLVWGVTK